MRKVEIYTDGSCLGNPGSGGWGAVLVYRGTEKELSGGEAETTNNRMELTAAIEALSALKFPCEVTLTTDSRYLCDGMGKGWAHNWREKGWKRADNSPALNPDLWEKLLDLCDTHEVHFVWVKGHAGHPYNERCDEMAQARAAESGRTGKGAAGPESGQPPVSPEASPPASPDAAESGQEDAQA